MRVILLCLGVCIFAASSSNASLADDVAPILHHIASLPLDLQRSRSHVPLGAALGHPNAFGIKELEKSILKEMGESIRDTLETLLKKLEELIGTGVEGLEELFNLLKHQPTKENAQLFINGIGDHLETKNDVGSLMEFSLDKSALAVITWNEIETRGIADWWEKIKQWFSGLGTWIADKYDVFKDWAKSVFDKAIDGSKPMVEQIKALAIEFLKNNWDTMSTKLVKQALAFFSPYAGVLGEQIMNQLIELARKHGLIPWEQTTPLFLH